MLKFYGPGMLSRVAQTEEASLSQTGDSGESGNFLLPR